MASMQDRVAASIHSKEGEPLNRLLAVLPDGELLKLQPDLEAVPLAPGSVLFDADERAERVYFLDSGVASLAAAFANRVTVGAATVGRAALLPCSWEAPPRSAAHACLCLGRPGRWRSPRFEEPYVAARSSAQLVRPTPERSWRRYCRRSPAAGCTPRSSVAHAGY